MEEGATRIVVSLQQGKSPFDVRVFRETVQNEDAFFRVTIIFSRKRSALKQFYRLAKEKCLLLGHSLSLDETQKKVWVLTKKIRNSPQECRMNEVGFLPLDFKIIVTTPSFSKRYRESLAYISVAQDIEKRNKKTWNYEIRNIIQNDGSYAWN